MKVVLITALLMPAILAWSYGKRGADWAAIGYPVCTQTDTNPQSPIDLPFKLPGLGDMKFASEDAYNKIF